MKTLNRPIPLWVQADAAENPLSLRRGRWRRLRRVARVQDRWRIDDEWWHEQLISRLYHLVRLEDDTLLAIYHDLITGAWFEQRGLGEEHSLFRQPRVEGPEVAESDPADRFPPLPVPQLSVDETVSYVELHLHTCYSFQEGASRPEELAARAAELGYGALGVADRNGLYGAMEFAQACAAVGIRPITGVELILCHGLHAVDSGPVHLTLLAETPRGYANLCRLITLAHRSSPRDDVALDPARLSEYAEGIIALSGGRRGEIDRMLVVGRPDDAAEAAKRLADCFGPDNTFIELQHNLAPGDSRRVGALARLAADLGLPTVATGDVEYHDRARHRLQDALEAARHHLTLDTSHRVRRPNSEFFLRSPGEAATVFAAYPEAVANAARIAERCRGFDLSNRQALGYEFPDFIRKPEERDRSADEVLANHCWEQFGARYPIGLTEPEIILKARRQLQEELRLVAKHRLAGFFLIYRDIQNLAAEVAREVRGQGKARGGAGLPPGRGRGSSVSSIICYLIGLSHVDPVKNRLFFQRFLNEDLQTVPDIDLDFARDIREQLILRMYERYGHDHTALVCSFATYKLRSAVRDLGKVLGLPPAAIDKLAKLSEGGGADTVRTELERLPEFQGQAEGPLWAHLVDLAEQLDGLPRHIGQHVGGMIVSSRPLIELVPIQPAAMEGRFICQWDKDSCDDARVIKIDFLALGMLSLVEDCLELIWESLGRRVDLGAISYTEEAVYDVICKGDTVGMFQIESRAQIQMLPRTQPRSLDELAIQVAIVRPGPIVGGAVNPYVRRREAQRQDPFYRPRADHPLLDQVLADTLGIVLYQDQVLEVAIAMGKFSAGQADQFRRAMSRRRSHAVMEQFRGDFLQGAREQGVDPGVAEEVFEKLLGFSAFGFPKSHAYAFAILAYQSAWLRLYYPAEYYAALLNSQPMGFYPPHVLVGDAKRHGVPIARVSLNRSQARCTTDSSQVQLGLTTVRGIGEELARALVAEREANGLYRSLPDLLRRTDIPDAAAENLIVVGALGEFGLGRRELLWQLGLLRPSGSGRVGRRRGGERAAGLGKARVGTAAEAAGLPDIRTTGGRRPGPARPKGHPAPQARVGMAAEAASSTGFQPSVPTLAFQGQDGVTQGQDADTQDQLPPLTGRQLSLELPIEPDLAQLKDMTDWERMSHDYRVLGMSPSAHPLGLLRARLPRNVLTLASLSARVDGRYVRIAGLVVCRQRPETAKGFLFLLLEDETAMANVVIRPALYETARSILRGEPYLYVEGAVECRSGSLNLIATRVFPLAHLPGVFQPPAESTDAAEPVPARPAEPAPEPPAPVKSEPKPLELLVPASHDFR